MALEKSYAQPPCLLLGTHPEVFIPISKIYL